MLYHGTVDPYLDVDRNNPEQGYYDFYVAFDFQIAIDYVTSNMNRSATPYVLQMMEVGRPRIMKEEDAWILVCKELNCTRKPYHRLYEYLDDPMIRAKILDLGFDGVRFEDESPRIVWTTHETIRYYRKGFLEVVGVIDVDEWLRRGEEGCDNVESE